MKIISTWFRIKLILLIIEKKIINFHYHRKKYMRIKLKTKDKKYNKFKLVNKFQIQAI